MAFNVLRLMALCRREDVQIIHARSRAPAWVALGAARRLGLPFVTTYHGSYSGRTGVKVLYNSVMARGDVVIACNLAQARQRVPLPAGPARVVLLASDGTQVDGASVTLEPDGVAVLAPAR